MKLCEIEFLSELHRIKRETWIYTEARSASILYRASFYTRDITFLPIKLVFYTVKK